MKGGCGWAAVASKWREGQGEGEQGGGGRHIVSRTARRCAMVSRQVVDQSKPSGTSRAKCAFAWNFFLLRPFIVSAIAHPSWVFRTRLLHFGYPNTLFTILSGGLAAILTQVEVISAKYSPQSRRSESVHFIARLSEPSVDPSLRTE